MQRRDALYVPVQVEKNDGKTAYVLNIPGGVPIDGNGFWSITVYDKDRFMVPNEMNRYPFNNVTAKKNPDGTVTIHFGVDPRADNYLLIMDGWLYLVWMYRPGKAALDGEWKFPEPVPAE